MELYLSVHAVAGINAMNPILVLSPLFLYLALHSPPLRAYVARPVEQPNESADERLVVPFGSPLRPLPFSLLIDSRKRPPGLSEFVNELSDALPALARRRIVDYYSSNWADLKSGAYGDLYLHEIIYSAMSKWGLNEDVFFSRRIQCVGSDFVDQVGLQIAFDYAKRNQKVGERIELTERAKGLNEAYYTSKRLFQICDGLDRSHRRTH
jgi:hypothetical protein